MWGLHKAKFAKRKAIAGHSVSEAGSCVVFPFQQAAEGQPAQSSRLPQNTGGHPDVSVGGAAAEFTIQDGAFWKAFVKVLREVAYTVTWKFYVKIKGNVSYRFHSWVIIKSKNFPSTFACFLSSPAFPLCLFYLILVNVSKVCSKGLKFIDILDLELKHTLEIIQSSIFQMLLIRTEHDTIMSYPDIIYLIFYVMA